MMGERLVMQGSLFYEFRIEDHVSPDHIVRYRQLRRLLGTAAASGQLRRLHRAALCRPRS
jgi:hypothetical protein